MNRKAFSLAEMMVAIGVLGIGLTMVACFFPIAMSQHMESTAQHKAMQIARDAKTVVENSPVAITYNTAGLPTALLAANGGPIAWLPTSQFVPGNEPCWEYMISNPVSPSTPAFGAEIRYVWYLFASQRDGVRQYFVAVTRTLPGHTYPIETDLSGLQPGPSNIPQPWLMALKSPQPFPATFRTRVLQYDSKAATNWAPATSLAQMLPPGTPIISALTGNVYTVLDTNPDTAFITLREFLSSDDDARQPWPNGTAKKAVYFLWFPPALTGNASPYVAGLFF